MDDPVPSRIAIDTPLLEAWLQCERRAWLQARTPALEARSDGLARYLATQRADLRSVLPHAVGGGAAAHAPPPMSVRLRRTTEAVKESALLCLDPAFEVPLASLAPSDAASRPLDVLATLDALRRDGDTTELMVLATGTRVREHHVRRLALASLVVANQGIETHRATVLHVDRRGRRGAPASLLAAADVTDRCLEQRSRLPGRLAAVAASLTSPREPTTATGSHCLHPRRCPFFERCWAPAASGRIERVPGLRGPTRRAWRSAGWSVLDEVPADVPGLTSAEREALHDALAGRPRIRIEGLRTALERLRFPIAYLDIEFATPAVPILDDAAPFDTLPFEFSVHLEDRDGTVRHAEHLVSDVASVPRGALAEALAGVLGDAESVVVYDAASERRLLGTLQTTASVGAASRLEEASHRLWDLLAVLQGTVRHPGFAARWDLKHVAAALGASSYDEVRLADGLTAQAEWRRWLSTRDPGAQEALRRYCAADSRAMLEIVQVLRTWLRDPPARST